MKIIVSSALQSWREMNFLWKQLIAGFQLQLDARQKLWLIDMNMKVDFKQFYAKTIYDRLGTSFPFFLMQDATWTQCCQFKFALRASNEWQLGKPFRKDYARDVKSLRWVHRIEISCWMLSLFLIVSFTFLRKSKSFWVIKCHNFLMRMLNCKFF